MKISIFMTKEMFSPKLQKKLSDLGDVKYSLTGEEMTMEELKNHAQGAELIIVDPDNFGGFEKACDRVTEVINSNSTIKNIALSTTSFGWIDTNLFRSKGIPVANIPGYSREAVAEHTLAMMLCLAKRIIVTDRLTQKGQYKLSQGMELKDKTLGIVGLGNIGSRVAELGLGIGMKVIAYNRSPRSQKGVEMVSLDNLLKRADVITFHVRDSAETRGMLNKQTLKRVKRGVMVVNTVGRETVNEADMAGALKSGKVGGYIFEAEDHEHGPLVGVKNAIMLKGFGWNTKESIERLMEILVGNVEAMVKGKPRNVVN
jgi:glycerate dehydrogenase